MIERHDFENGKYSLISTDGELSAHRYGEHWPVAADVRYSKFMAAIFNELTTLKEKIVTLENHIVELNERNE